MSTLADVMTALIAAIEANTVHIQALAEEAKATNITSAPEANIENTPAFQAIVESIHKNVMDAIQQNAAATSEPSNPP